MAEPLIPNKTIKNNITEKIQLNGSYLGDLSGNSPTVAYHRN